MRIHHLRNATMLVESGDKMILVDPMLGKKGEAGPPFTLFRSKPRRNPIVDMPAVAHNLLHKVTHCLITHLHPDHVDKAGIAFLASKQIPVTCSELDAPVLKKKGLNIAQVVGYWTESAFLGGSIQGIPATHGYGFVAKLMGNVMGYFIKLPGEKSLYLSSDTILTEAVQKVLTDFMPGIAVVAAGTAQLDLFQPLLMRIDDILDFVRLAPGKVIANHLEAVNHCQTSRIQLKQALQKAGLSEHVFIPEDGDSRDFDVI